MSNFKPTKTGPLVYGEEHLALGPPRLPNVLDFALYAVHDQCCPVWGCEEFAVLDAGIFQPCWSHQGKGYKTLQPGERRWRPR